MKKKIFIFAFLLMLSSSLVFAETLTIAGYKSEQKKEDTLPTTGNLIVSVYDTRSSQTSESVVGDKIDINNTTAYTDYISASKDIFGIKLQTNLKANITVSITFSPFINQTDKTDVISTTYSLTASGTEYVNENYYSYDRSFVWRSYYYIKHVPSLTVSSETVELSSSVKTATVKVVQEISSEKGTVSCYFWDSPSVADATTWSSYTNDSSSETLEHIESNAMVTSWIYVKMQLNTTKDKIKTNVDYKAPVKITVSAP